MEACPYALHAEVQWFLKALGSRLLNWCLVCSCCKCLSFQDIASISWVLSCGTQASPSLSGDQHSAMPWLLWRRISGSHELIPLSPCLMGSALNLTLKQYAIAKMLVTSCGKPTPRKKLFWRVLLFRILLFRLKLFASPVLPFTGGMRCFIFLCARATDVVKSLKKRALKGHCPMGSLVYYQANLEIIDETQAD